jgi:sodium transport system permease protein
VPRPAALSPLDALLCVCASLVGLLTVGDVLVARLGLLGVLASELALVGLPTVAWLEARGLPVPAALGLGRPSPRQLVGGALAGLGAFHLVALGESLLERVLPTPPAVREALRHLVAPGGGLTLALELIALAVAPAVCEEALFRGAVLPSLARFGRGVAVSGSALLFAGFHLSVYRFVPTALLGAVLGVVRLVSGSLWPAIVFHAVNNAAVIALVRLDRDTPPGPSTPLGALLLFGAALAFTVGLLLSLVRMQRS